MTGLVVDAEQTITHALTTGEGRWRSQEFDMTVTEGDIATPESIEVRRILSLHTVSGPRFPKTGNELQVPFRNPSSASADRRTWART